MHKEANIGQVELATISFGQSFQITPIQLVTTVSSIINGGRRITPHFGVYVTDETGKEVKRFEYPVENNIVTEEVSKEVREILEKVVSEGSGKNAFIEGIPLAERLQHRRPFQEVRIAIFPLFLDLHRQMNRRL